MNPRISTFLILAVLLPLAAACVADSSNQDLFEPPPEATYEVAQGELVRGDERIEVAVGRVTEEFFIELDRAVWLGRLFIPEEYTGRPGPAVILASGLWEEHFEGSPDVVGSKVMLDGQERTVVGVMPPGIVWPPETDLWIPEASVAMAAMTSAQETGSCVGILPISRLVTDALPEEQLRAGHSMGGIVNNQHHAAFPVPDGRPRLEEPRYPVHSAMEFRFDPPIADPGAFRTKACAAVEETLRTTCDEVVRRDMALTCSFQTSDDGRNGTVTMLPDSLDASADTLIVVADEW